MENVRRVGFKRNLIFFLAILGPGIITGSVDNDVGGITTYSVAGAMYGYKLLWTLVPAFVVLYVVQEMNTRMGIVTGKGLADLIRETAGIKITFLMSLALLFSNISNVMTEFAGVAGSMEIFGISKYISLPAAAGGGMVPGRKGKLQDDGKGISAFSAWRCFLMLRRRY